MRKKPVCEKPSNILGWVRIAEGVAIAVITGLITMYGTTSKLEVKFEMLEKQVGQVKADVQYVQNLIFQHIQKGH